MRIRVDALEARRVADEVGQDKVVQRHDDGSVELALGVSSFASIRSWVLGLLDHATVIEPPAFRDELVAWLGALTAAGRRCRRPATRAPALVGEDGGRRRGCARGVPGAETSRRLRRLLAVVGWLAQVGEAPIAEAARRFGMGEKELVAELELAACCGTPPYTPDTLMEIEVSEHSVRAFLPPEFARPRRLTPAEGFAVAASARLLLAVPGIRGRRAAPGPGQARRGAGLPRGGGPRRRRARSTWPPCGRRSTVAGDRDRLPLGLTRRAHDARGGAGAGGHDRRALVSRRLLPPRRRHAALPGRPDRCRPHRSTNPPSRRSVRTRPMEEMFVPGPGRARGPPAAGPRRRSGCPSPCPCAPWRGTRTGR